MESMSVVERTQGEPELPRRRQDDPENETGGGAAGFFDEGDSAEDELWKLMPSLKRQLEALDDDEGTLKFMGEISVTKEESFRQVDKESAVFDRDSIREARRRRVSGQLTASRPIDFSKFQGSNKSPIPAPSSSPYENIATVLKENVDRAGNLSPRIKFPSPMGVSASFSRNENKQTVLKENVNRAGNHSPIVDEFWSTEKKKKISAVARRRLMGFKSPPLTQPTAVEDKKVSNVRSRRGKGNSRMLGKSPIQLDLGLDAAKISEWDQETLSEEELPSPGLACFMKAGKSVPQSIPPHSGASIFAGRPTADVEEELPPSTRPQSSASVSVGTPTADGEEDLPPSTLLHSGASIFAGRPTADVEEAVPPSTRRQSRESISAGRPTGNVEEEVPPSTQPHPCESMFAGKPIADVEEEIPSSTLPQSGESAGRPAADSPGSLTDMDLSPGQSPLVEVPELSGRVECIQTPLQDPSKVHAGFRVPDGTLQIQRIPMTSPTPPSNPVAVYLKKLQQFPLMTSPTPPSKPVAVYLKKLEGQVRQRKLSFLSSTSSESIYTGRSRESESCIRSQDENALPTTSHDDREDNENLRVPDVESSGLQQNQEESFGEGPIEHQAQGLPDELQQNQEESFGDVPIENKAQVLPDDLPEAGDLEAAPPCVDAQQNNPPPEVLIETDEGSTTHIKPKSVKRREGKGENRRFSLEDCGSIWNEGQRRSQRIKIRPLEWWRGEKVLYARIHDSLTSVIGVKFSSPGKYARGIDEPFIVESYVPAQYSERVRFAAI
ncbi:unnamed protein product [Calypogeia fissa]